jgi:hypothetical protein
MGANEVDDLARNRDPNSWLTGSSILILTLSWGALLAYGVCFPLQRRLEERARESGA